MEFKAILGLFTLLAGVFAEVELDEGVQVLTGDNFDEAIKGKEFTLVEFYAPWCGHCKALAPEYAKAAKALADKENIALAKVDCTVHTGLAQKFGVRGYPTLKWFKGDPENALEYSGGRTEDTIVQWINKKTGPPAAALKTVEEANKFKDGNDVVVIGYFAEKDSADFIKAASGSDDVPFGITDNADVAKALDLVDGGITLFKKFDEGFNKYESGDILAFAKENMLAYVTEFSEKTAPKIFGGDIKKHVLMFAAKSDEKYEEFNTGFTASAKEFRGKVLFVYIDCDKADNGRILEFFGMKEDDCPDYRMIEMGKQMKKFKPDNNSLKQEDVTKFVSGVMDGTIERHMMSEDVPEENDEPVMYIVGKEFEKIVYQEDKAVFVEFYAPWCGHCKQLAPTWDKLGEAFADRDDVIIAKSDATANEYPGVDVSGFPTLKYFPKGEKKMVDYSGGRDLDSLKKFVESEGKADAAPAEEEDEDEEDVGDEDEDYEDDYDEDYEEDEEGEEAEEPAKEAKDEL